MKTLHALLRIATLSMGIALASCTTTQVSLDYQPQVGQMRQGSPEFTVGRFNNVRQEGSFYLGTVRTPIGAPVENITTRTSVEDIVGNAFAHAMDARKMLSTQSRAKYIVAGDIMDLYCQLIVRPYAYARIRVNVYSASSGQVIFSRVYVGERQSAAYTPGSGTPVPLLRDLTSRALPDAVDRALDVPEMRARIGSRGARGPSYQPGML